MQIFDEYPFLLELDPRGGPEQYDFDRCYTVRNPGSQIDVCDLAAATIISEGNYTDMARLLGRPRSSVSRAVANNTQIQIILSDLAETFIDNVEKLHKDAALDGDLGAQRFFLTTLGKSRGYVSRQETTGKDGEPIAAASDKDVARALHSVLTKATDAT